MHFVLYEVGTLPNHESVRIRARDADEAVRQTGYTMQASYERFFPTDLGGLISASYTLVDDGGWLYTLDREFPVISLPFSPEAT